MLDNGLWKEGLQMNNTQPVRPLPGGSTLEPAPGIARLSTVIASVPGIAEQALRATFEALPLVQIVGSAAGCLSALQMVRACKADLVVIDSNLPFEDVQVLLQALKQEGLTTFSLVLAATNGQVRRALAAGADAALRRDASLPRLHATVARFNSGARKEVPDAGDGQPPGEEAYGNSA